MSPVRMKPVKWDKNFEGDEQYTNIGGFKYDIIKKSTVHTYEKLPKHFLADTIEEAEKLHKEFSKTLNVLSSSYALSTGLDKFDLFGEALIGLARAKRDFDEKRSKDFKTFAIYKIKDALNDYVRGFSKAISIPSYLKKASSHLNILKGLLHSKGLDIDSIYEVLNKELPIDDFDITDSAKEQCENLLTFLERAAERANISLGELIDRVELLPEDMPYIDDCQEESDERRKEKMYAALVVENLKKYMDTVELAISEGIMQEKTLEEIAEDHGKSIGWVVNRLERMRTRLKRKLKIEGW